MDVLNNLSYIGLTFMLCVAIASIVRVQGVFNGARRSIASSKKTASSMYKGTDSRINPIQSIYNNLRRIEEESLQSSTNNPEVCSRVQDCLEQMNRITLDDICIRKDQLERLPSSFCMDICGSPAFQVSLFLLPKGRIIKLHDHPGMTVCSKVLVGSISVKAYNCISNRIYAKDHDQSIAVMQESVIKTSKDKAWFLSPSDNNIHEFEAVSNCIIFDILLPPYMEPERCCNFYKVSKYEEGDGTESTENIHVQLHKLSKEEESRLVNLPVMCDYPGFKPSES